MLSITFLGTSASVPSVHRSLPSISLKYDGCLLLFDCGEGAQRQMMKYKIGYGSTDAIFITHNHLDHFLGLYGLIETLQQGSAAPKKIKLFVPPDFETDFFSKKKFVEVIRIKEGEIFKNKDFSVHAFPVKHKANSFGFVFQEDDKVKFYEEKAKSLGIQGPLFTEIQKNGHLVINKKKIKLSEVTWKKAGRKIVYTGDTSPCAEVVKAAKNADLLIHESTFDSSKKDEAKERNHSTAREAAEIAKKAKAKQLVLTHISPRYAEISLLLTEAKAVFDNVRIAEDGLTVEV